MNETEIIQQLKSEGYDPVYVCDAEPNEEDPDHAHPFDTKLIILNGEIRIGIDGEEIVLKTADTIEIPQEKVHSGFAGAEGCRYIVAEKH